MKRSQVFRKPYRIKKKKPIWKNRFFRLGILIFIFFAILSYFLLFSEFFQVKQIIITGEKKISSESLEFFIENKLEKKLLFFKTKSIFLVNLNRIRKEIFNNFPQIAEVEMSRGFPDALNIIIIERLGLAVWCYDEDCFLLDNEGVIFEKAPLENNSYLKIQNLALNQSPNLGQKVIEKEILLQILKIESNLKEEFKIPLQDISLISDERLNIRTFEGWEIYFNPKGDLNWQLTKLRAVLSEEIPAEKRKNLEYIELRFGNFAPYKYR